MDGWLAGRWVGGWVRLCFMEGNGSGRLHSNCDSSVLLLTAVLHASRVWDKRANQTLFKV